MLAGAAMPLVVALGAVLASVGAASLVWAAASRASVSWSAPYVTVDAGLLVAAMIRPALFLWVILLVRMYSAEI